MQDPDFTNKIKSLFTSSKISINPIKLKNDKTNYIYDVVAEDGECIVKIPKDTAVKSSVFWYGLYLLFDLTHQKSIANLHNIANYIKNEFIGIPQVLQADATTDNPLNYPYVIMEKIQGEPISQKNTLEDEVIKSKEAKYLLGQYIGTIHLQNHSYFGTLETTKFDSKYFPDQFAQVIEILASSQKAQQDPKLIALLPYYLSLAKTMVPPQEHCLILLDLWPSQFLAINGQYSALIDIESYVVGPPGLELALLELWLGDLSEFKKGYFNVNSSWPEDLEKNRELYRYFLYLLYDCPEMGWDACRNSKGKFPQGDRLRSRLASPKLTPGGFNPYNPYE